MLIIHIHNDGTGDIDTGNYEYSVYINRTPIAHGYIEGHSRADGWEPLAIKVAEHARWIRNERLEKRLKSKV